MDFDEGYGDESVSDDNTVFIGKKGVMSYVMAVVTQFNKGFDTVCIKARGKSISRAVDVTQIVKNKFYPGARVHKIDLGTKEMLSEEGNTINVSEMEITLKK